MLSANADVVSSPVTDIDFVQPEDGVPGALSIKQGAVLRTSGHDIVSVAWDPCGSGTGARCALALLWV